MRRLCALLAVLLAAVSCKPPLTLCPDKLPTGEPSVAEAEAFMAQSEAELLRLWSARERANWARATYITFDTEAISAASEEVVMEYTAKRSSLATRYDKLALSPELRRKFLLLKLSQTLPAPQDAKKRAELAGLSAKLEGVYGKGKYCSPKQGGKCLALGELSEILSKSRNYDELRDAWEGWRTVAPPMRQDFARYVELGNEGARELGFANLGDLWKAKYDMTPAAFEAETDRLWNQVKPLYDDLHCYARQKLAARYGADKVPEGAPIPAHLLGNMWSQEWANIIDLLEPTKGEAVDLTKALIERKTDEVGMVKYGEGFFTSLGLTTLPKTFYERSMFKKPADREVVCHASAWDVDNDEDLRIKMCIKVNEEDFTTIHHELGHSYYQWYYRKLSPLFRDSANDGFHEGLGDTIALSVTPAYLLKLNLITAVPKAGIGELLNRALGKIAFLPFGLLVDRWRWDVFAGKIAPADYNKKWWELVRKYQGIEAPAARGEDHFDPGAKYHVPANVPYTRYFLAAILQFQFHRALCKLAGQTGPLHTCSVYGNKEVGARLAKMMEMGQAKPWPEALAALSGETAMDASAILEFFKPLHDWLREQNKGKRCGW